MLSKWLFGVHHSPQRTAMVVLAVIVVVMGIAAIPLLGWQYGIPVILLGLLSVAVASRQFAARDEKVATRENLEKLADDFDDDRLRAMVDATPHDPNAELGRVTGQFDGEDIQQAIDQVRGSEA